MVNATHERRKSRVIKAHLGKRSQLVLPKAVVESMNLHEGTEFSVDVVDGRIVLEPMISIPRSQAWFWTESWQKAEREAEEDVKNDRLGTIRTEKELETYLNTIGWEHD